jgi:endonuclease III
MVALALAKRRASRLMVRLRAAHPDAVCALVHSNALELLVATILSAQCTDQRVNLVTPELFRRFRTAADYAKGPRAELERLIRSTGFFRSKARHIQEACQALVERHGGQVPTRMEDLVALPGVGRKTANVVLGTAHGIALGVVVDTHVKRLSRRLGLSTANTPEKIERDLMAQFAPRDWIDLSHLLIHHGRRVCGARQPRCERCTLARMCPRVGVD